MSALDEVIALQAATLAEQAKLAQTTAEANRLKTENAFLKQRCLSLVRLNKNYVLSAAAPP